MRTHISLLLILMISASGYSSDLSKDTIDKGEIMIKFTPTAIIDFVFPRFEYGISYMITPNHSIQLKFANKFDFLETDEQYKTKGYKMGLEYQYHNNRRVYFSLEYAVLENTFTDNRTLTNEITQNEIIDFYTVMDRKIIIAPKFGIKIYPIKRIIIDIYCGLGVRKSIRVVSELDNPEGYVDIEFYEWFRPSYDHVDKYAPRLSLGLNINYRINL
ncbi:MAG: hypothetical protein K9H64_12625 [Bacteroidales bacterium]|nr:hypothetical protein [Bacteroidales bacterium]MCF8456908.1 hypothetical protein [Bacteroidales bacterium]